MTGFFQNFTVWDLLAVPAALLAIMIHEICHGLTANALGDPTAKQMKRLSFNPIRHVDPVGLLLLIVFGFGWAKPVPVDVRYMKNPKRGMALVALAGPLSNFILAFAAIACVRLTLLFSGIGAKIFFHFFSYLALRSTGLGIFNLFPVPPLDGSKILAVFLPDRWYWQLMRYERFGMIILLALVWLDTLTGPLSSMLFTALDTGYGVFGMSIPQAVQIYIEHITGQAVSPGDVFDYFKAFMAPATAAL